MAYPTRLLTHCLRIHCPADRVIDELVPCSFVEREAGDEERSRCQQLGFPTRSVEFDLNSKSYTYRNL